MVPSIPARSESGLIMILTVIKWVGTLASIAGAFIVASKMLIPGYSLFIVGSMSWLTVGIKTRDYSLIVLNGTFLCANILGLYNA